MLLKIKNLCAWCLATNNTDYKITYYLEHGNICMKCLQTVNRVLKGGIEGLSIEGADKILQEKREAHQGNVMEIREVECPNHLSGLTR